MKIKLQVIGLLLTVTAVAVAEMRTWTFEKSGKTMQGEVVGFVGNSVTMKLPDGKSFAVPIAYLTESNRVYLAAEQAKEWKEVEVIKLEGAVSAGGYYKKCTVKGEQVNGDILIQLLPPSVEAILKSRNQQAVQLAELQSSVESGRRELRRAEAVVHDANMAAAYGPVFTNYVKHGPRVQIEEAEANLAKQQAAYADTLEKTRAATIVKIKLTGVVYQGAPVWSCASPRQAQP